MASIICILKKDEIQSRDQATPECHSQMSQKVYRFYYAYRYGEETCTEDLWPQTVYLLGIRIQKPEDKLQGMGSFLHSMPS
ncbi:hypothetical protein Fmac_026144 [Flemingia macrophylla]|uniref:Uncharacterized protein n=1 Tax=Flemingia macrophylla TaxID=520843 RepID=A0ABD1LE09_9FABA